MTAPGPEAVPDAKLERIRKLLAKAAKTDSPHEAEAFTERAVALMAEYGVTQMMLNATERPNPNQIIERKVILGRPPYGRQVVQLANSVAEPLNCKVYYNHTGRIFNSVTIVGFPSDVERVEMLFTHLMVQAMRALIATPNPDPYGTATRSFRVNWFNGFNSRIFVRLLEAEKRARSTYSNDTVGTALVLADRDRVVKSYMDRLKIKTSKDSIQTGPGTDLGLAAGDRADIGGGKIDAMPSNLIGGGR